MPGLRTRARELNETELSEMIRNAVAILVGAAYMMYDQALAAAMHNSIMGVGNIVGMDTLTEQQKLLPHVDAHISQSWVGWVTEAHGNWLWLMCRCNDLQQSYERRFHKPPPLHLEFRRLGMSGPRPRGPGRTPFPTEPC